MHANNMIVYNNLNHLQILICDSLAHQQQGLIMTYERKEEAKTILTIYRILQKKDY